MLLKDSHLKQGRISHLPHIAKHESSNTGNETHETGYECDLLLGGSRGMADRLGLLSLGLD